MEDELYTVTLCFFVDVVYYFSRLLRGERVRSLKKRCGRERGGEKIPWVLGKNVFTPLNNFPVHGVVFVQEFFKALIMIFFWPFSIQETKSQKLVARA